MRRPVDLAAAHTMLCYADDGALAAAVVGQATRRLVDGGAVVMLATAHHVAAIEDGLEGEGFDVAALRRAGRLVALDAAEVAADLLGMGSFGARRFDAALGSLVRSTAAGAGPLFVFGELVAVLWAEGLVAEALELEAWWCRLGDDVAFDLLCAYPVAAGLGAAGDAFEQVCDVHDRATGLRGASAHDSVVRRFDAQASSVRQARRFVAGALDAAAWPEAIDVAVLLVSELAGNVVRHAGTPFVVSVERSGAAVRVAVADAHPRLSAPREADGSAESGRGLLLVDRLSRCWGQAPCAGGKVVWAEVDLA